MQVNFKSTQVNPSQPVVLVDLERKAGELLKEMEKSKGSKGNQYTKKLDQSHDVTSPKLQDFEILKLAWRYL